MTRNIRCVLVLSLIGCAGDDDGGGGTADARRFDSPPTTDAQADSPGTSGATCAAPQVIASLPAIGVTGTTAGAANNQTGDCAYGSDSADTVFQVTPATSGELMITLTPDAADLQVYARTTCTDTATQLGCYDEGFAGEPDTLRIPVTAGTPVFIFVDAYDPAEVGSFTLDVALFDPAAACAAATTATEGANTGDTTGGTNGLNSSCQSGSAPEKVYTFTPTDSTATSGDINITLSSAADLGVFARSDCLDSSTELACGDAAFGGTDESLRIANVTVGTPLTIVVDGFSAAEMGAFTLNIDFVPAICGDGILGGAEECEPANTPVCSATCTALPENTTAYCTNMIDDDNDGTTDCADTTMCSTEAECTPGAGLVGTTCTAPSSCAVAATGGAAGCLDETQFGWPGGACAPTCDGSTITCPVGSDCLNFRDASICVETCPSEADTECSNPAAYDCVDIGGILGALFVCLPKCTDNAQCPAIGRCDLEQGLCRPAEAGTCGDTADTDQDGDLNCGDSECIGMTPCPALTESEPNDTSVTATAYAAGTIGAIAMAADVDYYSISVPAGSTLTAEVTDNGTGGCLRPALDSQITIYGTDGTTVLVMPTGTAEDIDQSTNWCSRATTAALTTAGTYFVKVQSSVTYAPMDTFVYGLVLTTTP